MAHGIYLSEEEIKLFAEKGSSISHCPISNTCLKSGLLDVSKLWEGNVNVSLGTGKVLSRFQQCSINIFQLL